MADEWIEALGDLDRAVFRVKRAVVPEKGMPDAIGKIKSNETALRSVRTNLQSEAQAGEKGSEYELVEGRSADRSYSPSAIFADLMDTGAYLDLPALLRDMIGRKAVRITFGWTELKRMFEFHNLGLRVEHHEITDGDEAHVGEVWKSRLEVKPVERDDPF